MVCRHNMQTIFSSEGHLYQVEYAMEGIGHPGTCLGILSSDGIVLAENIHHQLNAADIVCSVAGIISDANVLTHELCLILKIYMIQYGESILCEQLVNSWLCDVKQAYTQYMEETFFDGKQLALETTVQLLSPCSSNKKRNKVKLA